MNRLEKKGFTEMIFNPKSGQIVKVHYRKSLQSIMPHHGKLAVVDSVAFGRGPRNVLIQVGRAESDDWIESKIVKAVIPRGNLVAV